MNISDHRDQDLQALHEKRATEIICGKPTQQEWEKAVKPEVYSKEIKAVKIDIYDIAYAWNLPPCLFNALKYILRAGKKEGEPKPKDLSKAIESIQRELGYEGTH